MGSKTQDELARLKPAPLASGLRIDSQGARLGGGAFGACRRPPNRLLPR
jgi:hypothetical protein